jgi:2'-5' RNA ligase
MHRLFAGIEPPEEVKDALLDLMEGVAGARWQRDDQLHLTLRFIGEVDRHQAADVAAALGSVHAAGFDLALSGVGMFDRRGRPEALWAGVTPHDAVADLHKKVDYAVQRAGLPAETRAYLPHITVARLPRGIGPLDAFMTMHGGLAGHPWRVTDFCLYESFLGKDGSVYEIVERYPLG